MRYRFKKPRLRARIEAVGEDMLGIYYDVLFKSDSSISGSRFWADGTSYSIEPVSAVERLGELAEAEL